MIALGCSQELAAGHAPVVHAALERGHVPVLPVPVTGAAVVQPVEKEVAEKSWSNSQLSRV